MPEEKQLQDRLKAEYGINKNVSKALTEEECKELEQSLQSQPSLVKLVESLVAKNQELGKNNANIGRQNGQSKKKLEALQVEHQKLENTIAKLEKSNGSSRDRRDKLSQEQQQLAAQIQQLTTENKNLFGKVQTLTTQNDQLTDANEILKKDNKDLKNIVDQIRLRLARDTQALLQYEDSEIRRALIRLFRWTLG
ncbi:MAG: hypothetical protein HC886_21895 [Leptolyngbyaceae cyanobacterium SM1_1_3]|nr:hypothetical protein [Leptolyngbyaceae cyanobacterium SM1_1_3]NJN01504.1 hypothetical protein [Leptolyngbyaceae cyanobacterium RM1_1_2]NJO08686.1 hypothetical protein [Leptolyngbyaceae cyanobacterium SL_1_1]